MPPAKRSASQSRSTSGRAQPKRRTTSSSARGKRAGGARGRASAGAGRSTRAKAPAGPPEARLDAAAERLRKLNERIIDAAKQTGETTLTSYEKALKSIASAVEHGPGSSDIDWISNLATAQAKFIREVTESWTSAARKMLK